MVSKRQELSKNYQVGREQTVAVGESVVKVMTFQVTETTQVGVAVPDRGFNGACEVRGPDVPFQGVGEAAIPILGTAMIDGTRYALLLVARNMSGEPFALAVEPTSGKVHSSCMWRNLIRGWVLIGQVAFYSSPEPVFALSKPVIERSPGDVHFELLYSGVSKQTIQLLYREYTQDNLARPAFYQTLSYDLADSDIVAFRSFRIKVIRATNQDIRYIVVAE